MEQNASKKENELESLINTPMINKVQTLNLSQCSYDTDLWDCGFAKKSC